MNPPQRLPRNREEFDPIARMPFIAVRSSGERVEAAIELGRPYSTIGGPGVTFGRCPVALHGLYGRLADISGVDEFQALILALALVRNLLADFMAKGGKFLVRDEDGESEYDILELFAPFSRDLKDFLRPDSQEKGEV